MFRRLLAFCALSAMLTVFSGAQEEAGSPGSELREVRKLVEHQSRQIDALTQEVARVTRLLEKRPADSIAPSAEPASPAMTPSPATDTLEAPKASPVAPPGNSHVVAKGETLTSIAKLYKVTVADLQKINKIENERTLQIGQTLAIPSPKPPEQPRNP